MILDRFRRRLSPRRLLRRLLRGPDARFTGAFRTREDALASVPADQRSGYDHAEVADINFERMCRLTLWDYPVLYWLSQILPGANRLIDAGGHMGTKYRAFRPYLQLPPDFDWVVYDVPEVVTRGRARAAADGLEQLSFVSRMEDAGSAHVLLASGLLQYLDVPLTSLIERLPAPPKHLVLNKVATRDGETVVTLERIGPAAVPYQIRNLASFVASLSNAGYRIVDQWEIPYLSHLIPGHEHLGASRSLGLTLRYDASA